MLRVLPSNFSVATDPSMLSGLAYLDTTGDFQ